MVPVVVAHRQCIDLAQVDVQELHVLEHAPGVDPKSKRQQCDSPSTTVSTR